MFIPATIDIGDVELLGVSVEDEERKLLEGRKNWYYNKLLKRVTDENGIINGSELRDNVFPIEKEEHFDVFISYSHNDEENAYGLYKYLTDKGLHVFLDSTVWYSADKLQLAIDEQYSQIPIPGVRYEYAKTQLSASHVHAMISMAILEVIDRSELCIFLKSDHSLTLAEGMENHTLSPWIYEELSYFRKIRVTVPERLEKYQVRLINTNSNNLDLILEQLKVQYNINLKGFIQLGISDLLGNQKYSYGFLDDLYTKHFILNPIL